MSTTTPQQDMVSAEIPDWSREQKTFLSWDPARSLLASIRSVSYTHLDVYKRQVYWSRNSRLSIFPAAEMGRASMKLTDLGTLYFANRSVINFNNSSSVVL